MSDKIVATNGSVSYVGDMWEVIDLITGDGEDLSIFKFYELGEQLSLVLTK